MFIRIQVKYSIGSFFDHFVVQLVTAKAPRDKSPEIKLRTRRRETGQWNFVAAGCWFRHVMHQTSCSGGLFVLLAKLVSRERESRERNWINVYEIELNQHSAISLEEFDVNKFRIIDQLKGKTCWLISFCLSTFRKEKNTHHQLGQQIFFKPIASIISNEWKAIKKNICNFSYDRNFFILLVERNFRKPLQLKMQCSHESLET